MPTYTYQCLKCEIIFEKFHSMSEEIKTCESCSSPVRKLVTSNFNITKGNSRKKAKTGDLVKQYIKDVKHDIKEQKDSIKKQEYEK